LKFQSLMYDLNDKVSGYYFTINDDTDATIGYVLVSASKNLPAILQYGQGQLYGNDDKNIEQGNKFYYLGAFKFLFADNALNAKAKFNKAKLEALKSLKEKGLEGTEKYIKTKNYVLKDLEKSSTHEKGWQELLSPQTNTITAITSGGQELSVSRMWQRTSGVDNPNSACGPTTGAMISNYYKSLGYSVRGSSNYGGDAEFINHMYFDMNTDIFGTFVGNFGNGLVNHLNGLYLPSSPWYELRYDGVGNYPEYESAIMNNRPVGIMSDLYMEGGSSLESWHWIVGVGYDYGAGDEAYFGIKDPDGGQYNIGTHWHVWTVNDQDMTFVVTDYN